MYYIFGGLGVFGGLFPLIYVAMGVVFLSGSFGPPERAGGGGPPPEIGWFFIVIGGMVSLLIWTMAALNLFVGYNLSQKKPSLLFRDGVPLLHLHTAGDHSRRLHYRGISRVRA